MACRPLGPSAFLVEKLQELPRGKALDLACGAGRNAIFLAQNGYNVDAVDCSLEAIEEGKKRAMEAGESVNFIVADLIGFPLPEESYDLIINFNYLERTIATNTVKALKPGGALLFETFSIDQKRFGPPRNKAYLLDKRELKEIFKDLDAIYLWEGVTEEGGKKKAVARILAVKALQD